MNVMYINEITTELLDLSTGTISELFIFNLFTTLLIMYIRNKRIVLMLINNNNAI